MESPRHLLVDGYNILHAWGWLAPQARPPMPVETARARLVDLLHSLHDSGQCSVTLVFDGRAPETRVDAAVSETGLRVLYAPADRTADTLIETRVASDPEPGRFIVATGDLAERETVAAAGAHCLAPEELLEWCLRTQERTRQQQARRQAASAPGWGTKLPL